MLKLSTSKWRERIIILQDDTCCGVFRTPLSLIPTYEGMNEEESTYEYIILSANAESVLLSSISTSLNKINSPNANKSSYYGKIESEKNGTFDMKRHLTRFTPHSQRDNVAKVLAFRNQFCRFSPPFICSRFNTLSSSNNNISNTLLTNWDKLPISFKSNSNNYSSSLQENPSPCLYHNSSVNICPFKQLIALQFNIPVYNKEDENYISSDLSDDDNDYLIKNAECTIFYPLKRAPESLVNIFKKQQQDEKINSNNIIVEDIWKKNIERDKNNKFETMTMSNCSIEDIISLMSQLQDDDSYTNSLSSVPIANVEYVDGNIYLLSSYSTEGKDYNNSNKSHFSSPSIAALYAGAGLCINNNVINIDKSNEIEVQAWVSSSVSNCDSLNVSSISQNSSVLSVFSPKAILSLKGEIFTLERYINNEGNNDKIIKTEMHIKLLYTAIDLEFNQNVNDVDVMDDGGDEINENSPTFLLDIMRKYRRIASRLQRYRDYLANENKNIINDNDIKQSSSKFQDIHYKVMKDGVEESIVNFVTNNGSRLSAFKNLDSDSPTYSKIRGVFPNHEANCIENSGKTMIDICLINQSVKGILPDGDDIYTTLDSFISVNELSPPLHTINSDRSKLADRQKIFIFPYIREMLTFLHWACLSSDDREKHFSKEHKLSLLAQNTALKINRHLLVQNVSKMNITPQKAIQYSDVLQHRLATEGRLNYNKNIQNEDCSMENSNYINSGYGQLKSPNISIMSSPTSVNLADNIISPSSTLLSKKLINNNNNNNKNEKKSTPKNSNLINSNPQLYDHHIKVTVRGEIQACNEYLNKTKKKDKKKNECNSSWCLCVDNNGVKLNKCKLSF
jgi:hypothetical protein